MFRFIFAVNLPQTILPDQTREINPSFQLFTLVFGTTAQLKSPIGQREREKEKKNPLRTQPMPEVDPVPS
jgi:hypothetical protein